MWLSAHESMRATYPQPGPLLLFLEWTLPKSPSQLPPSRHQGFPCSLAGGGLAHALLLPQLSAQLCLHPGLVLAHRNPWGFSQHQ